MSYSNGVAGGSQSSTSSSRSKRELIDRIRYPNPIPTPPYPPKLVKIPTEPSRYANPHFADRLASQHPLPMIVDAHAGMPIDLANFQNLWEGDLSEVVVPPTASLDGIQVDEADSFLLQDFASALPSSVPTNSSAGAVGLITSLHAVDDPSSHASLAAAVQHRQTQSLGPGAKSALAADDVTWLRRTEYLSAQQKQAQQQVQKPRSTERIDVSREAQLAKIEQSFTDAQKPMHTLLHPNKKGVKAVQVFDFLPDPETWATDYQIVRFIDHPGRIIKGVPQPDPRLDVAIFRPTTVADGEQRVSYYLPAGEEVPDDLEAPMTLIDNPDLEEQNAKRLRKRRRTGKFPHPEVHDDNATDEQDKENAGFLRKDYATAYKWTRDYVPKDTAETSHDVLVLTLDDGVPDPDPDADVDPIKGVKPSSTKASGQDDEEDLFGEDEDQDEGDHGSADVKSTLPPQSAFERQKRSRRSADTKGKEKSDQPVGEGLTSSSKPKARAYYHKVQMRFTLRVWRSRFTNNEKLRNRDRRYPGKWDAIVLSNRELQEREMLRRLHARSQVDDVGELDPYESSDAGDEDEAEPPRDAAVAGTEGDSALVEDGDGAPGIAEDGADGDVTGPQSRDTDDNAEEKNPDGQASERENDDDRSDEDEDDDDDDDEDDEEGTVDGDEELAALRAEMEDAGEELGGQDQESGGRRSRKRRTAPSSTTAPAEGDAGYEPSERPSESLAAAMEEDD